MLTIQRTAIVGAISLCILVVLVPTAHSGVWNDAATAAKTAYQDAKTATKKVARDTKKVAKRLTTDAGTAAETVIKDAKTVKKKIKKVFFSNRIDGSFEDIYPTPFFQTSYGTFVLIGGSAVLVATVTYFTAGSGLSSAGPISTWVGTQIGMATGVGSGATAAGLAVLGGGTIASGGLGIAGGLAVLAAISDVGIMIALDQVADAVPESHDPANKYRLLRIPLPRKANDRVIEKFDEAERLVGELEKLDLGDPRSSEKAKQISDHYKSALELLQTIDPDSKHAGYDYIARAVLEFNFMEYEKSLKSISKAMDYAKNKAFCGYMISLIRLTQGGEESLKDVANWLDTITNDDPEAIQPYLLQTIVYMDLKKPEVALQKALIGLENVDDNFELNWRAAEIAFHNAQQYETAVRLYESALANITKNEMEAQCKMMVALSHYRLGRKERAHNWYGYAIMEIYNQPNEVETMSKLWFNLKQKTQ